MEKNRKLQILKKIIKESVREVIQDEFRQILKEELENANKNKIVKENQPNRLTQFQFDKSIKGVTQPQISNSLANMLKMTAQNMDSSEYSNIQMNGGGILENGNINSMPNQSMMDSIGEIEEWVPSTNMNIPNFPR